MGSVISIYLGIFSNGKKVMAQEEIKFAVLGFGGAGRTHVRRLSPIEGVRVVKVYEPLVRV